MLVRPLIARGAVVDAVEVHPDRAAGLQGIAQDNLRVRCANFLTVALDPVYRWVVLNPPFCGTHFMDHVRHAFDFLGVNSTLSVPARSRALSCAGAAGDGIFPRSAEPHSRHL